MIAEYNSYKRFLPALLWALLLFFLSSLPSYAVPSLDIRYEDLVLHFLVYTVLGYFLGIAFAPALHANNLRAFFFAALIGIAYAASDEFHQTFVQGRFAAVSDFIADSIGVLAGLSIYLLRMRRSAVRETLVESDIQS